MTTYGIRATVLAAALAAAIATFSVTAMGVAAPEVSAFDDTGGRSAPTPPAIASATPSNPPSLEGTDWGPASTTEETPHATQTPRTSGAGDEAGEQPAERIDTTNAPPPEAQAGQPTAVAEASAPAHGEPQPKPSQAAEPQIEGTTVGAGAGGLSPEDTRSRPPAAPTPSPAVSLSAVESGVVSAINAERRNAGLQELVPDAILTGVARDRSADMAQRGYFSHTTPEGTSCFDLVGARGGAHVTLAENLFFSTYADSQAPGEAIYAWMQSAAHRANILNSAFTRVGVGIGHDAGGSTYITAILGGP